MRLRTQLILAFVVLAVVPLAGVVGYTYLSNVEAMKSALAADAGELTDQLEVELGRARADLRRGLEGVERVTERGGEVDWENEVVRTAIEEAMNAMGSVAESIDLWQVIPSPPAPEAEVPPEAEDLPPPGEAPTVAEREAVRVESREELEEIRRERRERLQELRQRARRERELVYRVERKQERADGGVPEAPTWRLRPPDREGPGVAPDAEDWDGPGNVVDSVREEIDGLDRELEEASRRAEQAAEAGDLAELARTGMAAAQLALRRTRLEQVLGRELSVEVEEMGRLVPEVDLERFLGNVLARTRRVGGAIPYLADAMGYLYTREPEDREQLLALVPSEEELFTDETETQVVELPGWLLAHRHDPETGFTFGIARPYDESFSEIRARTGRNLLLGFGMIGFSLLGIFPLSGRLTRRIRDLSEEAERIASGDLEARAPVEGRDELSQLAQTFNEMVVHLQVNQKKLVDQERQNRRQEVSRLLLEAENRRRGEELEEARLFQMAMLPERLPDLEELEVAVYHRTATEVGGDYYDFAVRPEDLTIALGDATGHGARAGTLVTVIKTLFLAGRASESLAGFLDRAAPSIRGMGWRRMAMSLVLVRVPRRRDGLTLACAGMPPAYRLRADGEVEEMACHAVPLGSLERVRYQEKEFDLATGDTLLLLSDGLPEQPDEDGDPIGYRRVVELLEAGAGENPAEIVARLERLLEQATGGGPPADDVTLLAVRRR